MRTSTFLKNSVNSAAIMCIALGSLATLSVHAVSAQNNQPTPSQSQATQGNNSIFAPLQLTPYPSQTRLANGAPGPKYWQNRADYALRATLDTAAQVIRGSMVLRYTNNSPNTLDVIWLQTERAWPASDTVTTSRFSKKREGTIQTFNQMVSGKPIPLTLEGHQTVTKVSLAAPLKPGQTATFESTWFLKRKASPLYEITQWYPRLAVYDDVKGWNTEPWIGEYFLEYGDFTMEITLPAGYIVAGTGTLDNPSEVLTTAIAAKLARAVASDTVVRIITREELTNGSARPQQTGMLTWKFHAKNVRDAVWTAATDYCWDGIGWHGILNQAFYRTGSPKVWKEGAEMVRRSIQEYSEHWWPYPYPQATAADAFKLGMEYPMLTVVTLSMNPYPNFLFTLINHEIGHQWFPMIVGSNERAHGWMDEGFTTFIDALSEARWYPKESEQMAEMIRIRGGLSGSEPIETPGGLDINDQYDAPGAALYFLRKDILGPTVFDKAMQTYVQRWAYKHPTPADFFRTIEDVSKHKLDWFWREWFYTPQKYDLAIDSVIQTPKGDDTQITVTYHNFGSGVLPILATLTYSDGTKDTVNHPAEVWQSGSVQTMTYVAHKKTVSKIQLDPTRWLPDENRKNNTWLVSGSH
jgi:hypothetical protein